MWGRVAREALIAVLVGSIPMCIAYGYGDADGVGELLTGAVPEPPILIYWILLIVPYFLMALIDRYIWKKSDTSRSVVRFLSRTFKEVGPALLSLWRVMAGYLLMIPVLWLIFEPETLNWGKVGLLGGLGAVLLVEAIAISAMIDHIDERWIRRK